MPLFKSTLNLEAHLIATTSEAVGKGAKVGEDILRSNVSAGPRSGRQYANQPRVSSAPGEFPQEQTGDLRDSVGSRQSGPLTYDVGFLNVDLDKALPLEFGSSKMAARAPEQRTFEDKNTHDRMLEGAVK